jgi:integrase
MPKRAAGLTVREVETKGPGLWADGRGLYLHVTANGTRSWIYRYQLDGKRRDMGLGPVEPGNELAHARDRLAKLRALTRDGIDPIDAKRKAKAARVVAQAKAMTFRDCAEAYIARNKPKWRSPKSLAAWEGTLRDYAYPVLGELAAASIDTTLVLKVLEPIWNTKTETASRLRGRIESVLDFAKALKVREGDNPAAWRGNLDDILPAPGQVAAVDHHAALDYRKIAELMARLAATDTIASRALRFTVLTCARTGEALGARWDEIDMAERLWVVPKERMKSKREHVVALSDDALAILAEMQTIRTSDHVFPGQKEGTPLSNMALLMLMRRLGHGDLTVHGFRSTFRDWAAEKTNFPSEAAEIALAHQVGDKVERAYRRGDLLEKRRELATAWAAHCR